MAKLKPKLEDEKEEKERNIVEELCGREELLSQGKGKTKVKNKANKRKRGAFTKVKEEGVKPEMLQKKRRVEGAASTTWGQPPKSPELKKLLSSFTGGQCEYSRLCSSEIDENKQFTVGGENICSGNFTS